MYALILLLQIAAPPADTVELSSDEALGRLLEFSPRREAADLRGSAGLARAAQARAWANPGLSFLVENVGAAEPVTGLPAPDGLEGQAVLTFQVPLGGDRGARIEEADASARAAQAQADFVGGDVVLRTVETAATVERDGTLAGLAGEEARTLGRLAEVLTLQAEEGEVSEGEAARTRLAAARAEGLAADARASSAAASAELARLLGYPPDRAVTIRGATCSPAWTGIDPEPPPEVGVAAAREEAARAGLSGARAGRIPDLEPQVGLRRTAGTEALYLGFGLRFPLFDRQGRAVEAAAAEFQAASADRRRAEEEVAAGRLAARRALEALEEAGDRFRGGWSDDLDRVVESTEARFELGEGSLVELLDGRRARFEALAARAGWRAAWRVQHARLLRLSGMAPSSDFFCDPLAREG